IRQFQSIEQEESRHHDSQGFSYHGGTQSSYAEDGEHLQKAQTCYPWGKQTQVPCRGGGRGGKGRGGP
ncbi:Os04g0392700, partial [Oryza sativa Japonica Group]